MCWSREDVVGRFGSPIAAYMPFITQHPDAQVGYSVHTVGNLQQHRPTVSPFDRYFSFDCFLIHR